MTRIVSLIATIFVVVVFATVRLASAEKNIAKTNDMCRRLVEAGKSIAIGNDIHVCAQNTCEQSLVRCVCVREQQLKGLVWVFAETSQEMAVETCGESIDSIPEKYRVNWSVENEIHTNVPHSVNVLGGNGHTEKSISIALSRKYLTSIQRRACEDFLNTGILTFDAIGDNVFADEYSAHFDRRGRFLSTNTTTEERHRMREGFATIFGMMAVLLLMALPLVWMVLLTANWV